MAFGAAALSQVLPEGVLRLVGKGGLWLAAAHASSTLRETVEYLFTYPDPTGRNGEPDPTVWSKDGTLTPQPVQGIGGGYL